MGTFGIISADSHVYEPPDLWARYLEPAFRSRAPRIIQEGDAEKIVFDGMEPMTFGLNAAAGMKSEEMKRGARHADGPRGGWDPHARVKDMDLDGVDAELLYPSLFGIYRIPDPEYKFACFRAYNDWLADLCGAYPKRLAGAGLVAIEAIEAAVQELRRIARKGLRSASITCSPPEDQPFSHPRYEPFWREAEALGIPLSLHAITQSKQDARPSEFMVSYSISPVVTQESIATFIASGVLERYPKLTVVSVENDTGWAGTFLRRLDHAFERHRFWSGSGTRLTMRPSEYFHRQVYLTFQDDKPGLAARYFIGVDNLLWASDYPHSDSTWPESHRFIQQQMGDLPEIERRKIVHDNAAKLYGFA